MPSEMMTETEMKPEAMTVGRLLAPEKGNHYLIPRYQRNYAWGEKEISQLVRDVEDYRCRGGTSPYYIGTLVVHRGTGSGVYETVDGQQRLTTLSILMAYLRREGAASAGKYNRPVVGFQSRAKSQAVIEALFSSEDPENTCDPGSSLTAGFKLVAKALGEAHRSAEDGSGWEEWLECFSAYLRNHVVIFRVPVPHDTNLNHYFEVMNSRGEQLEKHEVLKAELMGVLSDPADSLAFGKIWEACANMEKYVQMSFAPHFRSKIFGSDWDGFIPQSFDSLCVALQDVTKRDGGEATVESERKSRKLGDILAAPLVTVTQSGGGEGHPDQFHPVINFPNFLLHVLSVHSESQSIPLDDKNLLGAFEPLTKPRDPASVKSFAYSLLYARYLFDQFVMKRDLRGGSDEWSLLRMKNSSGSGSYTNPFGEGPQGKHQRRLLMLQAALHVSNPSMSYKYWVLGALRFLMTQRTPEIQEVAYLEYLESMARGFVFDIYLAEDGGSSLADITGGGENWTLKSKELNRDSPLLGYKGTRNNLIFNFLDYLLWVGNPGHTFREGLDSRFRVDAFKFTMRSSVEHHSPQHPDGGTNTLGEDVHRFGNLYLISHAKNSRLSNFLAETKKGEFLSSPTADSLKQQFMIDDAGKWNLEAIGKHEDEMFTVLSAAIERKPPFAESHLKLPR